jgi:hypothetical protein
MTLTLVLWLQNGRKFEERAAPDLGCPLSEWRVPVHNGPPWLHPEEVNRQRHFVADVRFVLTEDPVIALRMYQIGRRRFHYICDSDWMPRSHDDDAEYDCMPPHVREAIERQVRTADVVQKHLQLMEVGKFPVRRDD